MTIVSPIEKDKLIKNEVDTSHMHVSEEEYIAIENIYQSLRESAYTVCAVS